MCENDLQVFFLHLQGLAPLLFLYLINTYEILYLLWFFIPFTPVLFRRKAKKKCCLVFDRPFFSFPPYVCPSPVTTSPTIINCIFPIVSFLCYFPSLPLEQAGRMTLCASHLWEGREGLGDTENLVGLKRRGLDFFLKKPSKILTIFSDYFLHSLVMCPLSLLQSTFPSTSSLNKK